MSTAILTFGKFSGKRFCDTPSWYQKWAQNQPGFMARLSGEPIPPKKPAYLDGHSRKSQDFENRYFEYEQAMADKYDPAPDPFTDRF